MPIKNPHLKEQLIQLLARQAGVKAPDLAKQLGISPATLHRHLQANISSILASGKARRTRYALRRPLRGSIVEVPVYQIDDQGHASILSTLIPVYPTGSWMPLEHSDWPIDAEHQDGWWDGLPYPLYDLQPQGFMGRHFARAIHHILDVPETPQLWNDDQLLYVLIQRGSDLSGNLIVGDPAFELWQQQRLHPASPIPAVETASQYAQLAEQAIHHGTAGSSAAGEFPKFTAMRELAESITPHVIVKFSGAEDSKAVTRWADLLVCEHLALEQINTLPGLYASKSRVLRHSNRTFLELERFDRHGQFGRSALLSMETVNAALLGKDPGDWSLLADALAHARLIDAKTQEAIHILWWYGKLIANTDMHLGNLSFQPKQGKLQLAPSYDMLPMLYAPLAGGEVPVRNFEPPHPLPRQQSPWLIACEAAIKFWNTAASDPRIGNDFHQIASENGRKLLNLRDIIMPSKQPTTPP